MNKLRNTLKKEYSQIPNELITDMTLPAGALRVILYLFTKPDDWSVYNKDICKQLEISEQTLTKYWKILLASKWLRRELSAGKDGKLTGGYIYRIGNFTVSIHSTEQVKSIELSNNKLINKQVTGREGHPDEEQVVEAGRELGIDEDVCIQFYLYYSSKGWKGILDFVPLLRKWNMNQKKTVSVDEEESWMRYAQ